MNNKLLADAQHLVYCVNALANETVRDSLESNLDGILKKDSRKQDCENAYWWIHDNYDMVRAVVNSISAMSRQLEDVLTQLGENE